MTDGQLMRAVALVGQPLSTTPSHSLHAPVPVSPIKSLNLAAFGPPLSSSAVDYSFRIYVVMDTDDTLQVETWNKIFNEKLINVHETFEIFKARFLKVRTGILCNCL